MAVTAPQSDQVRVIHEVLRTLDGAQIRAWLFGGWGLDARLGHITRDHGDIELWVEQSDARRSRDALVGAGATVLNTQPEEEACEFLWADVPFSTAYFDRRVDGMFASRGRWSDWVFPVGSIGDAQVMLDGVPVPVMSTAGMLAMKEQYPQLRYGRPWRSKDIQDLATLREMLTKDGRTPSRNRLRAGGQGRKRVLTDGCAWFSVVTVKSSESFWESWERIKASADPDPLEVLRVAAAFGRYFEAAQKEAISFARSAGLSWEQIAEPLGQSRQALWQRASRDASLQEMLAASAKRRWEMLRRDPISWYDNTKTFPT